MPVIVACAACQTKLKVPDNSTAKALRCPKCKGIVPIVAKPAPKPTEPPKEEEELEVNEAVDEKEEELEVNEAANEEEELEVNEAADEEEEEDEEAEEEEEDEDSALVELGFGMGTNPFKKAKIPDEARKAIEKAFAKKEKPLWAGRPSAKIIESKAWIGLVVGPILVVLGLTVCLVSSGVGLIAVDAVFGKVMAIGLGGLVGTVFALIGVLAFVFRKNIGGNVKACYVVTNKRAYIYDGTHAVRAFTPNQLTKIKTQESTNFPGAGDLIFGYDLMGDQGVMVDKEKTDRLEQEGHGVGNTSTPVGFLNIDNVALLKKLIHEILVEPAVDKAEAKVKRRKAKAKERSKPSRPFGND